MTTTRKTWKASHRFSTATLAGLYPTSVQIEREMRQMRAQRSLRGEATDVTRDEVVALILNCDYTALKIAATTRALNMRWRRIA